MTEAEKLKSWLEKSVPLKGMLLSVFIFLFFTNLSLITHESGHVLATLFLGGNAGIGSLNLFSGYTNINGLADSNIIWVALAGPLLLTLPYASYLYFFNKDSILRLAGIISVFYSILPSLSPLSAGTDMSKAIKYGLSPKIGWLIFLGLSAFFSYHLIQEITEDERPFSPQEPSSPPISSQTQKKEL